MIYERSAKRNYRIAVKLSEEENYFPIRFVGVSEKYNTEMRINYEWIAKKYLNKKMV